LTFGKCKPPRNILAQIRDILLRVSDPLSTEAFEPAGKGHVFVRQFHLRVLSGPNSGELFTSKQEKMVIGTHESADFRLTDPTLSRFHCEVALEGGKAVVRDLSSRNGTIVDGTPVLAAFLRDGATLSLGQTQVRFELTHASVKLTLSERTRFGSMIGQSVKMRALFAVLERAAAGDSTVLLTGETGTGKDLAAESLHREGARRNQPLVVVDCGAIAPSLLEAELFGHERGAFTGADRKRVGAFESAHGGTLFLDEIGELPLDLQPKLLRALDRRQIQPLGSNQLLSIDVRLIAATNRNLRSEVNERRFRGDLYYRLSVLEVALPPLRDRLEDLPLLAEAMLSALDVDEPKRKDMIEGELMRDLRRHSWPGNVRELRNYLERCTALADRPQVDAANPRDPPPLDVSQPLRVARERFMLYFERSYLEELLHQHKGNVSAAARAAGMDRVHFHRLLSRCGLR
jgi:transcriptional regulator with GAF, ATPase, and Fis domain